MKISQELDAKEGDTVTAQRKGQGYGVSHRWVAREKGFCWILRGSVVIGKRGARLRPEEVYLRGLCPPLALFLLQATSCI